MLVAAPCQHVVDAGGSLCGEFRIQLILLVFVVGLCTVGFQALDVDGVQGGRAGVTRVEEGIQVEEHILAGEGFAVRELDAVLDGEGVLGVVVVIILRDVVLLFGAVGHDGVGEGDAVTIPAAGEFTFSSVFSIPIWVRATMEPSAPLV